MSKIRQIRPTLKLISINSLRRASPLALVQLEDGVHVLDEPLVVLLQLLLVLGLVRFDQFLVLHERSVALVGHVLEARPQLVLVLGRALGALEQLFQEHVGHLGGALVHRGADAALEHHLQDFRVRRLLDGGRLELLELLLDVLYGHLNGGQHHLIIKIK